uniref:Uncharacterized protein n=1 Tax=Avena sativa TaxID=4498 RepID=A0ACD5ULX6_AVESA
MASGGKLAALALLALLGCVARPCEASYGYPSRLLPSPSPPPSGPVAAPAVLAVGHYNQTCYQAEQIVRAAVKKAVYANRGIAAGLIRLFFHDCFVRGCDASILLDETHANPLPEKLGRPNYRSLRGFEVIDQAKMALKNKCQGVVSCADIVAFAARDATMFLSNGTVQFDMPSGRFDGRVSLASETLPNLPSPFADLRVLRTMFESKGLSLDDMVTLSGAHTVGISHCSSFADRLRRNASDPLAMHSRLADSVRKKCRGGSSTVDHDFKTPRDLDSQYYRNVLDGKVLLQSDAALMSSSETEAKVRFHAYYPWVWAGRFKAAMVKMGGIQVKTSANGEIRKHCRFVNAPITERVYVLSADS